MTPFARNDVFVNYGGTCPPMNEPESAGASGSKPYYTSPPGEPSRLPGMGAFHVRGVPPLAGFPVNQPRRKAVRIAPPPASRCCRGHSTATSTTGATSPTAGGRYGYGDGDDRASYGQPCAVLARSVRSPRRRGYGFGVPAANGRISPLPRHAGRRRHRQGAYGHNGRLQGSTRLPA